MSKRPAPPVIRLRGVRHNNLKNFDLDLPVGKLIVITGLSGSGKSSLAFDTLFAEGQRRYIETFSPYARQFLDRMDKPRVDSIEGIPPAIAIEQRNTVRTTRSTVGTMTEICDYAKLLWFHLGRLHCRGCGEPVGKDSSGEIWTNLQSRFPGATVLVTFELPLAGAVGIDEALALIARQGYQRLLVDGLVARVEEAGAVLKGRAVAALTVVQDRVKLAGANRSRFIDACEQAYHFGKGRLSARVADGGGDAAPVVARFSNRLHCAACDIEYREPSPALFSFNHPVGACPECKGFGRIITIDYNRAVPDGSLTLAGGAVKPWQTGQGMESQRDLAKFCRKRRVPMDVPFGDLPEASRQWVLLGDPGYGKTPETQWPRAWYGVKGYFEWLESKAYKMHVRVLLSRYRAYQPCPSCGGKRLQPEALQFKVGRALGSGNGLQATIADFYAMPIRDAAAFVQSLAGGRAGLGVNDPLTLALREVESRLRYLEEAGLGYLTLDRSTRSLSGGETERVNLTTCLGAGLVNTLFVLDEPSVGLHSRDTGRLVRIVERLRDAGNTVVVVEHEASVIRAADQIVDIGPGHGESGGNIVFQGVCARILKSKASLTGQYLSGRKVAFDSRRRPVDLAGGGKLVLKNARLHNLEGLSVEIPLERLVCVTGVSGSGKTTLVREVLFPLLRAALKGEARETSEGGMEEGGETGKGAMSGGMGALSGTGSLARVVIVDQSPIGRTPRSNPAVYAGAFDFIRDLFARSDEAKRRGLTASAFSFNSPQGQCERCRGAGFEKIEMQFLSDVFIRCPDCDGRRYREHILEVKIAGSGRVWSIADMLEATSEEASVFLEGNPERAAARARESLRQLQEIGLGYLRLGQPINTLSGGECQRLKLVSHLAAAESGQAAAEGPALFLFDEPTTGLHFDDVRVLLNVFHRLVEAGHSLIVIEHNLDVIRSADWLIDLGPEAGDQGGRLVAQGTPEAVAACASSHTGAALAGRVIG